MSTNPVSPGGLLLVPSAIEVPDQLRLDVGPIPTGMIPLDGQPMLEHLAEAYNDYDLTRVVAVGESVDLIMNYVSRSSYQWRVVDVSETSSLGETVYTALDALDVDDRFDRSLYINFADTLVSPLRPVTDHSVVSYQERDRSYRWTTFEIDDGRIANPTRKNKRTPGSPKACFTGQFGLENANLFYQALQETSDETSCGIDYFYRGLLTYLESTEYELYEPDSWLDVGHLDTYHRAKKRFLNAREFNDLKTNGKNVLTKRSDDPLTLIDEITWYNNIPTELQPYLPRIYDYSTDREDPYLKIEYIGYPLLSDLQLYASHGQHIWDNIFQRLFSLHREFQSFTVDACTTSIQQALREIYIEKTRRRLERLRDDDRFQPFFDAPSVQINGTSYPSLNNILDGLEDVVIGSGLLRRDSLSVIHGDLCFPNVLYDPRNEILKLIDPRGRFGQFDIHGDPRYDFAKLRHSVVGHYEHLINGQFEVSSESVPAEASYTIYTTEAQDRREDRFDSFLSTETDGDVSAIKLIEALLFLSMVPLHGDSFDRQQCMLAQGIEKITPYMY